MELQNLKKAMTESPPDPVMAESETSKLLRVGTRGTAPDGLGRPKEGSARTQPINQKTLEDHNVSPKA
jgi:hypothetical protein